MPSNRPGTDACRSSFNTELIEPMNTAINPSAPHHPPKVSIGMPVYNGDAFIREALDSLLAQTFTDFELIISDNASTDDTQLICQEYAANDCRIRYVRQSRNIGAAANFQFVLKQAVGKLFMWAAADDSWDPRFISLNIDNLTGNKRLIGSIGRVLFCDGETVCYCSTAVSSIRGPIWKKLALFLRNPSDNSRFYSLFYRDALINIGDYCLSFYAADWLLVAKVLTIGDLGCVDEVLMRRQSAESSRYLRTINQLNKEWLTCGFPLLPFTVNLIRSISLAALLPSFPFLLRLNIVHFRHMRRYKS